MAYTDTQLKQALAKMLSKEGNYNIVCDVLRRGTGRVLDTELLNLCRLVEETLSNKERDSYISAIWRQNPKSKIQGYRWNQQVLQNEIWWTLLHATWEQRTIALAKVKGVETV